MNPEWLFSPVQHIRWTTLIVAAILLIAIGLIKKRPMLAVITTASWMLTWEMLWQFTNLVDHHGPYQGLSPESLQFWGFSTLATLGWPLAAYALGVKPDFGYTIGALVIYFIWIAFGFTYNIHGQVYSFQYNSEIFNVSSKTLWGLAYLIGAIRTTQSIKEVTIE